MLAFNRLYGGWALGLLAAEVAIARWAHDALVRPYGGDFLVVPLVYCALKTVLPWPPRRAMLAALLLAYAVELAQYAHLLAWLGWARVPLARLVLGTHFAWADMLAYTLGAAAGLAAEALRPRRAPSRTVLR